MKIYQIMSRAFDMARPDESVESVCSRMRRGHVRHMVVVDRGEVLGYVSHRTLRPLAAAASTRHKRVNEVMNHGVILVNPEAPVLRVANQLRGRDFSCVTAVRGGRVWGILTMAGLLEAMGREDALRNGHRSSSGHPRRAALRRAA